MSKEEEKEDDSRYEFNSVKFAHELMVDVLGALIPGALFLFCIILSIVFPIICYSTQKNNFGFLMKDGDWFWIVAFLSFLILSYVLGLIFYRADIKLPDKADIRREQEKKLKAFIDGLPVHDETDKGKSSGNKMLSEAKRLRYAATLLEGEIKPLADALCEYEKFIKEQSDDMLKKSREPYGEKFKKCCDDAVEIIKHIKSNPLKYVEAQNIYNQFKTYSSEEITNLKKLRRCVLCIMFPETIANFDEKDSKRNDAENIGEEKKQTESIDSKLESNFPNNTGDEQYYDIAKELFPEMDEVPFRSRSVLINTVKIVPMVECHTTKDKAGWFRRFRLRIRLNQINQNSRFEEKRIQKRRESDPGFFELFNMFMVSYLILHMQNESGCATERRCDFPYMSYYKYLLKRRLYSLLRYADWATSSARTKNQINKYKIDLQLHVPNAYAVIIKNESHIRMASSSWHVARVIRRLSWVVLIFTIFVCLLGVEYNIKSKGDELKKEQNDKQEGLKFVVNYQEGESHTFSMGDQKGLVNVTTSQKDNYNSVEPEQAVVTNKTVEHDNFKQNVGNASENHSSEDADNWTYVKAIDTIFPFIAYTKLTNDYLAILFPLLTLLLSYSILKRIPQFIHYQRLREIYFTLEVYMRWEQAKRAKAHRDRQNLNIRRSQANMTPLDENCEPPFYF